MHRIVREHYPREKLPEDIRKELHGRGPVKLLVEQEEPEVVACMDADMTAPAAGHFTRWKHRRRAEFTSADEIDSHISALRDEWDRR